jgi:hypothetical protein
MEFAHMDSTVARREGTVRLACLHDDHSEFDRAFWSSVPPAERLAQTWVMVAEYLAWRQPDAGEPRLRRSVCRLERR